MAVLAENAFLEIAATLGLAAVLGLVGLKLRQPLLIMFLVTGVLAGPSVLGILSSYEEIELLAHMGIALLLFIVGMRLDLDLVRTTGGVALVTGVGQIVFTSAIGFGLAMLLGMNTMTAAYVAVALTFSSTIIIVKLLSDKREIDALHGRIALGFLIVQDIAAIAALVLLTTFGGAAPEGASPAVAVLLTLAKGGGIFLGVAILGRYVLPVVLDRVAESQEALALFAITWAVALGALSDALGFSKEVGAFLAGIALASTPYRDAIGARLTGLRDFLLLFFFIDLGARLEWGMVANQVGPALLLSLFVLIGNPLIVMVLMGLLGYRRRTGFLAGLTVAQISEFSLIVGALGVSLGHINEEAMGLITLVGVVTILLSTYMILYADALYRPLAGSLKLFERADPSRERVAAGQDTAEPLDVLLVGVGNYGSGLAAHLLARQKRFIILDFDPAALEPWRKRGVPAYYGDVGDPDFYEALPLGKTKWVVCTLRTREANLLLLQQCRARGFDGKIAVTGGSPEDDQRYRAAGADLVLQPWADAAEQAVATLERAMDVIPVGLAWPVAFRELAVGPLSPYAGQPLDELALFRRSGCTVLAVGRGAMAHYEPAASFVLQPGDRLLVMGPPERLTEAEAVLEETRELQADHELNRARFEAAEVLVPPGAPEVGQSLAALRFRERYGVSVVGLARGAERLTPNPDTPLQARDVLVVVGPSNAIARFHRQPWL